MDSWGKLDETNLPPKECFYSKLAGKHISDEDYVHAQKVWKRSDAKIWVTIMTSMSRQILHCWLMFSKTSGTSAKKQYGLDPAHYFTSPGLSWDALLKKTGVELELLTDYDLQFRLSLGQFLTWCKDNKMVCNPSKCKKLVVRKKNHSVLYSPTPIHNIPQCNSFVLLGVTLQSDGKFNGHVRTKLVKTNKCLHVLRTLRKEHYSQAEIDHLFIYIVLPNFSYVLSVYGASESDLTVIQNCLIRCHKRRFISSPVSIENLLIKQDRNIKEININGLPPTERHHSCPENLCI